MTITLSPSQHAILAHAIHHTEGQLNWFPDNIRGGARKKVIDALFNRALITPDGSDWSVSAEGYDALGMPRPGPARGPITLAALDVNLATFRAIAKKYTNKDAADILRDLVKSEPGAEGKWFAAAKDAGLFDVAIELARRSPTDPRTLTRAARDFASKRPEFAIDAGLTALHWMARGHGYELTGFDVHAAFDAVMQAALGAGLDEPQIKAHVRQMIEVQPAVLNFVQKILQVQLSQ